VSDRGASNAADSTACRLCSTTIHTASLVQCCILAQSRTCTSSFVGVSCHSTPAQTALNKEQQQQQMGLGPLGLGRAQCPAACISRWDHWVIDTVRRARGLAQAHTRLVSNAVLHVAPISVPSFRGQQKTRRVKSEQ